MKINVDFIYPIGSVYISTQPTNPSVLFGGVWKQTAKSRAIVGAGSNIANTNTIYGSLAAGTLNFSAGELIGEPTHTLTINEMPKHNHSIPIDSWYNNDVQRNYDNGGGHISNAVEGINYHTSDAGEGRAHNNIMPIEVYYIWKRVS